MSLHSRSNLAFEGIESQPLTSATHTSVFKRSDEFLHLLSPLVFLPFLVAELCWLGPLPLSVKIFLLNFIEVGLGSAGHNGLSWGLIFLTPEGRIWVRRKGGKNKLIQLAMISLAIFSLAITLFYFVPDEGNIFLKLFLALDWILVIHHSLSQTRGISFMYSFHSLKQNQHETLFQSSSIAKVHRHQKLAFNILILLMIYPMFNYVFELNVMNTDIEKWTLAGLMFACVSWITTINFKLPSSQRNKLFYLSRLLYLPMTAFSFFAAISFRVIHAIEYVFIYRKMLSQSKAALLFQKRQIIIYSLLLFFGAVFLWAFSVRPTEGFLWAFPGEGEIPFWLKVMAALSVTRLNMHYYLDRQIFRMRDPVTRKYLGHLVRSKDEVDRLQVLTK